MRYELALLLAVPFVAHAQVALFQMNGSTEVPIGSVLDLGKVAAGDTLSVRLRVRNSGSVKADITRFSADGAGFTLDRPSLPFTIAPGSVQDVLLSFQGVSLRTYSASLQLVSSVNSLTVTVVVAVVTGAELTVFPACTGSDGPPPSIDFGRAQVGQIHLCNFNLRNPGTQDMTISTFGVSGSGFRISFGPQTPFKLAAGSTTSFVVTFAPGAAAIYKGTLAIETRSYVLNGVAFDAPLPKPLLEFDSGPFQSAQQRQLTIRLPTAATSSASGSVSLAFLPDTKLIPDDPAVVFLATGTRSLPISITQGNTQFMINGQASAMFQTGTSWGRIRFSLSGISTDGDPTTTVAIPASSIALDTATATKRAGNLDVQVIGYDNTYSAGSMSFTFFDSTGKTLPPGAIQADFTQDFRSFFTRTQSGSAFQVRVSFPVTGDASGIAGVDARFANSAGVNTQHLNFQ
jgi:Abnormal spindle-like microcephaly-assoc'd, ASPM-SPD-2-Hydin